MFEAYFLHFLVQSTRVAGSGDLPDAEPLAVGPDPELWVMIRAEQPPETDEELMHKHHEQFDKLANLLSTDIGDNSAQSLRQMVLEWQDDSSRYLLTVSTGRVKWVLQKHFAESSEGCSLCHAEGKRPGLVLDRNLEVISTTEAGVIADYLALAIQQSRHEPSPDADTELQKIRDNPNAKKKAPPSIKDDVSVSVRNDKPYLAHNIAKIRQKDAEHTFARANSSPPPADGDKGGTRQPALRRQVTQSGHTLHSQHNPIPLCHSTLDTLKPTELLVPPPGSLSKPTQQKTTREKATGQAACKPRVSVLFLSPARMRKILSFSLLRLHGYLI